MTCDRQSRLSQDELNKTHQASMEVLSRNGLAFHCEEALSSFKANGFKVSGEQVFFTENDVLKALETVPKEFCFSARSPE